MDYSIRLLGIQTEIRLEAAAHWVRLGRPIGANVGRGLPAKRGTEIDDVVVSALPGCGHAKHGGECRLRCALAIEQQRIVGAAAQGKIIAP